MRASEPEKGARFAEATIKAVTGGEEITVRHLNHGFFDFVPQFKLTLSGNHKPAIRGQDRGIWRRFLLVPWEVNVPDEQQDKDLPAKLWAERDGVLNWILDGVRIWLECGLVVPDRVRAATDEYGRQRSRWPILSRVRGGRAGEASRRGSCTRHTRWCSANAERGMDRPYWRLFRNAAEREMDASAYMNVKLRTWSVSEPPPYLVGRRTTIKYRRYRKISH